MTLFYPNSFPIAINILKNKNVIAREQSDRSNPKPNRRIGVSPVYQEFLSNLIWLLFGTIEKSLDYFLKQYYYGYYEGKNNLSENMAKTVIL